MVGGGVISQTPHWLHPVSPAAIANGAEPSIKAEMNPMAAPTAVSLFNMRSPQMASDSAKRTTYPRPVQTRPRPN